MASLKIILLLIGSRKHLTPLWVIVAIITASILFADQKSSAEDFPVKRVLVLNSYHSGYPWSDNIMRGVFDVFSRSKLNIEPYVEYMDLKRFSGEDYVAKLKALYQATFKNIRVDVILASDNDAYDFMRKNRDELFPGVPIVFCGVNDFDDSQISGIKGITGVVENNDYEETIALALKLRPKVKNIVVVTDETTTGHAVRRSIEKIAPDFAKRVHMVYLSTGNNTLEETGDRLARLKDDSVVLLLHHFIDRNGLPIDYAKANTYLTKRSPVPTFVSVDTRMGLGPLGGKVTSGYLQGEAAAQMAVKILNGTDVNSIPVLKQSPNKYVFDWRVMQRFHIPTYALPGDSIIINRPESLYTQYRLQFITAGGAFVVLVIFNILMFFEIRRRKGIEAALRESEFLFRSQFDFGNIGIALSSTDKRWLHVNRRLCQMLGYSEAELVGKPWTETAHPDDLPEDLAQLARVFSGEIDTYEMDKRLIHKNGSVIYTHLSIACYRNPDRSVKYFIVSLLDITGRKAAEKRARAMAMEWQNTFDAIKDPISIHDKDFNVVRVNKAFADKFGLNGEDVIGKKCFGLLHGCDRPPEQCPHLQAQATKQPVVEQFYDQNIKRHIEISVWPRFDKDGNILGVVHAFKDITERIEMERAVQEGSEKLKSIFRAAPTGIGVVVDRVFKEANDQLCEMVGYSKDELIGQSARMIYPSQEEFERVGTEKYGHIDKKGTGTIETHWQRKDGQVIDVLLSSTPLNSGDLSAGVTFTALDISERIRAGKALRENEAYLRSILDNSPTMMWLKDTEGRFLAVNESFVAACGKKDPAEVIGKTDLDVWPRELAEKYRADDREVMETRHKKNVEELVCDQGVNKWFETYKTPILDASGEVIGTAGFGRDVTERKVAEQALAQERNLLRMLIDNLPDSIYVKDRNGRKILTNRADLDFIGAVDEKDVLGKTDAEVFPEHLSTKYHQDDQVVLQHGRAVINREEVIEDASGIRRWLLTSKLPVKDPAGQVTALVGIGRDITERKHLESRLLTMAHYDTLTKLPNRTLFFERSNTGISQARRTGVSCAVLFVDLDHFKSVNDTLGHTIGDELLKDTAGKLTECVREMDTIARLGGDEFIIFLNGLETAQDAQHIAERIREKFNTPRQVAGNDLFITASIGIATFPNDGENLEELLKNADAAMYAAKDSGRNAYCFFDTHMNQKAVTKMQIERGLRDALAKSEFRLFYQPIVGTRDGKLRGFEALLRWFRSEGGLVTPNEFIPVAEDTGLIVPIGEWVLHQACRFNKQIIDAGYGKPVMSVNISVAQLRRKNIVDAIRIALDETGLPPECLEVEVTESILIQSFDSAVEVLKGIRDLGVQVSLDDFGTGYSSLSHLQRLPIANLKIDRLFIKEIGQASEENDLTPAIIELAHKLKLKVVAEGVETDIQLERLARDRCDYFQGFLFCKPMPEDRVFSFLEENRSRLTLVSGR